MKVLIVNKNSTDIGSTVTVAKLYDFHGKLVGRCIDTPNAIATVLAHVKGIDRVIDGFGELVVITKSRIKQNKVNPLSFSGYLKV